MSLSTPHRRQQIKNEAARTGQLKAGKCILKERKLNKPKLPFSHALMALKDLETVIEHRFGVILPNTLEARQFIEVAAYSLNARLRELKVGDLDLQLAGWCHRWCPWVLPLAADVIRPILRKVETRNRNLTAEEIAHRLSVGYLERRKLGLTQVGAFDVSPERRQELTAQLKRMADRDRITAQRRLAGVKPRWDYDAERASSSLETTRPWEKMGISRRAYFRRKKSGTLCVASSTSIIASDAQSATLRIRGTVGVKGTPVGEVLLQEPMAQRTPEGTKVKPLSRPLPSATVGARCA